MIRGGGHKKPETDERSESLLRFGPTDSSSNDKINNKWGHGNNYDSWGGTK